MDTLTAPIHRRTFLALASAGLVAPRLDAMAPMPLPETKPLTLEGDLARLMVDGLHKFLDEAPLSTLLNRRERFWKVDYSSTEAYLKSVQPNRERFRKIIGVVEKRVPFKDLEYIVAGRTGPRVIATGDGYSVFAVRWPVLEGVDGEGLLLQPDQGPKARVVALPDADWSPEAFVGMRRAGGVNPPSDPLSQFARRLAENGCQVIVPVLIDRQDTWSGNPKIGRMTNQPHREFIYRMAYEMGRHIIGYEVQKVLAAVDWFEQENKAQKLPVGVLGYAEGGLIALSSAAADQRIDATLVSGYSGKLRHLWEQPIYRNVWALQAEFGEGEVGLLVAPRGLVFQMCAIPDVKGPPPERDGRRGAAPGRLTIDLGTDIAADRRVEQAYERLKANDRYHYGVHIPAPPGNDLEFSLFLKLLGVGQAVQPHPGARGQAGQPDLREGQAGKPDLPADRRNDFDPMPRLKRQFDQLVGWTQKLMRDSEQRRQEWFWSKLDLSSLEKYQASCRPFRAYFWEEVIGKLPPPTRPANPRTRLILDEPKWRGYEVMLDLYPDVFACGILTVPKDLNNNERRPVVVCQHGLEGRPGDVVNPKEKTRYYHSFGSQLADRGFIVFAPQNPVHLPEPLSPAPAQGQPA